MSNQTKWYQNWRNWLKIIFFLLIAILLVNVFISKPDKENKDNNEKTAAVQKTEKKDEKSKSSTQPVSKTEKDEVEKETTEEKNSADTEEITETSSDKTAKSARLGTTDKIPVTLAGTVDGDTAKFTYNGQTETFRFLLIDTPETKHPRLGKQPFGQEASDRTAELLQNADQIEVEFDVGQKQDKYQRYLAYIYVDGEMLNDILVREGLAKVAYVYPPNTRYLTELEQSQEAAKAEKLGIWSLNSAFEDTPIENDTASSTSDNSDTSNATDDATEDTLEQDASSVGTEASMTETTEIPATSAKSYANCTELHEDFPDGVPSSHPAYASHLDRDKDDFACEVN